MNTLFPIEPVLPQGFTYHPDFISKEEEIRLVEEINNTPLTPFIFQGYEAKRRVASFGYDWNFEKQILTKGKDIPTVFFWLIDRVAEQLTIEKTTIAELLITEYTEGTVINWHRDAPPFDTIAGISLLSDCIFKLKPHDKQLQSKKAIFSFPVKRRSLYIMQGEARSAWQHSIAAVKHTRYSITLRTLRTNSFTTVQ